MLRLLTTLALLMSTSAAFADDKDEPKPNTLTPKEIADGWILLFDGETTFGWEPQSDKDEPKPNLSVKDGALVIKGTGGRAECTLALAQFELHGEYRTAAKEAQLGLRLRSAQGTAHGSMSDKLRPKQAAEWRPLLLKVSSEETIVTVDSTNEPGISIIRGSHVGKYFSTVALDMDKGKDAPVELRNLKLRPLAAKPLFTGKNLDGWKVNQADPKRAASKWDVTKDGELSVKNGPGDLVTEKEFDNFVLQFECKTLGKALNSGIFFRCIPGQYQNGYEAQVQNAYKDDDRTKPADFGTGAIYRRIPARKVVSNDNEWFTMTVVANGKRISTWVNGYQTVDWLDDRKESDNPRQGYRAAKGPLSIQGHDPTTDILFRNIRVAELPAEKK